MLICLKIRIPIWQKLLLGLAFSHSWQVVLKIILISQFRKTSKGNPMVLKLESFKMNRNSPHKSLNPKMSSVYASIH